MDKNIICRQLIGVVYTKTINLEILVKFQCQTPEDERLLGVFAELRFGANKLI